MSHPAQHPSQCRGLTLIELLVVVALMAVLMGAVIIGMGARTNAQLRSAVTLVSSGVRVAFTRAASNNRAHRLVFDMDHNTIVLEETTMPMLVRRDDETRTGGAEGATPQEKEAIEEADRIVKGPSAPRPLFRPVKALGFDADDPSTGRQLGSGVHFKRIEVAHSPEPQTSGRAYLYFWPGGQTERASIQVGRRDSTGDDGVLSILISPLTGKVRVVGGAESMEELRSDSEREDRGL